MSTHRPLIERRTSSIKGSEGAILIVSLILLLVMTLVGIAAIDSTSLQSQMARNSLFAQSLYQNSRSEIEGQYELLKGFAYLEKVMTTTSSDSSTSPATLYTGFQLNDSEVLVPDPKGIYNQSARLTYTGDGTPPSGYSIGLFVGKNFEVNPITEVPNTGSISDQTQGLNYPAPL